MLLRVVKRCICPVSFGCLLGFIGNQVRKSRVLPVVGDSCLHFWFVFRTSKDTANSQSTCEKKYCGSVIPYGWVSRSFLL
ncbi:hypothetical protein DL89DRAFT_165827 [Linderina pennispora]|uniref:Uncharacterized protein n=1 Tax=Linderina pennispora TaxID=61395 RepID=A0A1Y1W957_9FUNG|nr:uncharacterized protein DL89DRAFT_165827 [Linderina pennispora]ORX69786.1 hypothetical protein DL89DRAFT_165827 [Linderina pennispora]